MSFMEIIILLIIAGISGAIGQALTGFSSGGCFLSIAVGFRSPHRNLDSSQNGPS